MLPKIIKDRHKYQTGYVISYAGSSLFPGAAKLAGLAALKAGAGIVRIFSPSEIGEVPYELIANPWKIKEWQEAIGKAQSVFIGPGLGQSKKTHSWLKTHLKKITLPCVIDADALLPNLSFPKGAILTPHRGEAVRLLALKTPCNEEVLFTKIESFCQLKEITLVLKGAPTTIFGPKGERVTISRGDPGMAKAGSGDVLTGIIAALLAQGLKPMDAATLGVTLHGIAGEKAASEKTSYCLLARDLIEFMPAAFREEMDRESHSTR